MSATFSRSTPSQSETRAPSREERKEIRHYNGTAECVAEPNRRGSVGHGKRVVHRQRSEIDAISGPDSGLGHRMSERKILVVEDELGIRKMIREVLLTSDEGYEVEGAQDPRSARVAILHFKPDLVILDLNLGSRFDGLDLCRELRADSNTRSIPVIVLTGELMDAAESTLLDAGADDYIRKAQFTPRLLESRVRAVLRRTSPTTPRVIEHGPLVLHPGRREAIVAGKVVPLTPTEFSILSKLAYNAERVLPREELLQSKDSATNRTVDVHVLSIRRKLKEFEWLVQTVHRRGYRIGVPPNGGLATPH